MIGEKKQPQLKFQSKRGNDRLDLVILPRGESGLLRKETGEDHVGPGV